SPVRVNASPTRSSAFRSWFLRPIFMTISTTSSVDGLSCWPKANCTVSNQTITICFIIRSTSNPNLFKGSREQRCHPLLFYDYRQATDQLSSARLFPIDFMSRECYNPLLHPKLEVFIVSSKTVDTLYIQSFWSVDGLSALRSSIYATFSRS